MRPGLVSITFRKLSPAEIVRLCVSSGLQSIEWGGDIHVPPGNLSMAEDVGKTTQEAGLAVAAYGSYYRLGATDMPDFEDVLASAVALGAPAIRVWAGTQGSSESDAATRQRVAGEALRCADLAGAKNISVCYEFHQNTLTDTTDSALDLLEATRHPFIRSLWQPPHGESLEDCVASLRTILPFLHHVHVFHWWPDPAHRMPLDEGTERWQAYIEILRVASTPVDLLLEFVRNDDPAQLTDDARTLRSLLEAPPAA